MLPCALCSPDAHLTACDSTLRMAVRMAAVAAAMLLDIDELADLAKPWQSGAASFGGGFRALFARCRRSLAVPIRVAPL